MPLSSELHHYIGLRKILFQIRQQRVSKEVHLFESVMNLQYHEQNGGVMLTEIDSFDIEKTLTCGQCFRYEILEQNTYYTIAHNRFLLLNQNETGVFFFPCTISDFKEIWMDYFDLHTDYEEIKETLSTKDEVLSKAISFAPGIRILNQDPYECTISFILSQNRNIPLIRSSINLLCQNHGIKITNHEKNDVFAFPEAKSLIEAGINGISQCKAGFRSKYVYDACCKIANREIELNSFQNKSTHEVKEELKKIYGIGDKVSDCILLFSCKRPEVFPTDVWVKRVMEYFYFNEKEVPLKEIQDFAKEKFKNLAGFAQQYLFYYARELKIGK